MWKEILFVAGGTVAVLGIFAAIKYQMSHKGDDTVERAYVDVLNMGEIKKWFVNKMENDSSKGVVLYPTEANAKKWNIEVSKQDNTVIQIVYDGDEDKIKAYREIAFSEISPKLKELLDSNDGAVVIDR